MSLVRYDIWIDIDRTGTFDNALGDVTNFGKSLNWRFGLTDPFENIGTPATGDLILNNADGRFSLGNPAAQYYGLITRGTLVRVRATYKNTTVLMFELKIGQITVDPVLGNPSPNLRLSFTDIMTDFMRSTVNPVLQQTVRTDEVLQSLTDQAKVIWPYDAAFFYIGFDSIGGPKNIYDGETAEVTNFDEGFTSFSFVGDNNDRGNGVQIQGFIRDIVAAEFFGMFFFQARTGVIEFFNRYHATIVQLSPYIERTSSFLLEMSEVVDLDQPFGEELTNDFELSYTPREVGAVGSVLYTSPKVPFELSSDRSKKVAMRYIDPNNEAGKVGGFDMLPIQKGVDLVANTKSDGSGDDVSDSVIVSEDVGADKTNVELFWGQESVIYITTLQKKGTPLLHYDKQSATGDNAVSINQNGRFKQRESSRSISDLETAQNLVDWKINALSTPKTLLKRVSMVIKTASTVLNYLTLTIGDLFTLIDEFGIDTEYMIVGEQHAIELSQNKHTVTWIVRAKEFGAPFIVGSTVDNASIIGGTDLLLV